LNRRGYSLPGLALVAAALIAFAISSTRAATPSISPIGSVTPAAVSTPSAAGAHATPWVNLIEVDGAINPASAEFIQDSIQKTTTDNAAALVIQLDTPGGLLTSAQQIVKALLNSPVPVIVYVAPPGAAAASAGTFITVAANIAAMAPGTTIGAAHPVEMGGGDVKGTMGVKIENFTASFAQTVAHTRGRNEAWVEQAVRQSSSISEREALKLHVIDLVAPDLRNLLVQINGREVKVADGHTVKLNVADAAVRRLQMRLGTSVLNQLADPNIMYILMIAGVLGLYFEFAHPGVYLPGVAGTICLLLALASFQVIPINLAGLLLLLFGIALLISEMFVTSYGILGMGGVVAFVLGSLFVVDTSESNVAVNREIIAGAAVALTGVILGIGYMALHTRRGPAKTGREGLVGEIGEVRDSIEPGTPGRLFVHGENWRAVSDTSLAAGTRALVTAVDGLQVVVRPVTPTITERG
jgi:membrane-bound serine protease (ClpP class)